MNTRILGAVTAVTLVLPHRDKHIATELTINYHTVTLSNTIAIIVIFNYESSIIFLTHSFY